MTSPSLVLRPVVPSDLPIFFEQQRDPEANWMAAFTVKDPADREAFDRRWARNLDNPENLHRTIEVDGQVAGSMVRYMEDGHAEVTYWLGKAFWGQGIATRALALFLETLPDRPVYARVAVDNPGSRRVLEKCGFRTIATETGFANARGTEIEEYVMIREA